MVVCLQTGSVLVDAQSVLTLEELDAWAAGPPIGPLGACRFMKYTDALFTLYRKTCYCLSERYRHQMNFHTRFLHIPVLHLPNPV